MSKILSDLIKKFDPATLFQVLIFVGVLANLWLSKNFVTRAEYDANQNANKAIDSQFQRETRDHFVAIETAIALMQQNNKTLEDHEARIRMLERSRP